MFVHAVCVLHRREPHGVLALLTHHMQDPSHQKKSIAGLGGGGRESGGGLDLVCRFFLSARSGVKAQCKVYMFENSKLIFADMFKFLSHECCEMHIVSPATPSGSVL